MNPPPSPTRWSHIPFDILEDWERRDKRLRVGAASSETSIANIPNPILAIIFTCISDPRTRNSMALVCMEWYTLERATRTRLCLRGCVGDLHLIPRSFQAVEVLNLSHCSPWGYSLFQSIAERALLVGHVLKQAFPRVKDMTLYVRDARDIDMVAFYWPGVQSLKLVRWHQRPTQPEEASGLGMEFRFLMQSCKSLRDLDLSEFYCWTEDIPLALKVELSVSNNLRSLNLLKVSVEGFKATELEAITSACTNLEELRVVLVFDPRFLDFVDDAALVHLGTTCKKLRVLHLIDNAAFSNVRSDPEDEFADQDAQIGRQGLVAVFQALPLLEDLAIVLSQNVRDAGPILEGLATHCKRLTSLCLGHFHGLCRGPQPEGIALCSSLMELVIKNCADLDDMGMAAIATGCTRLRKLGLHSCKKISKAGLCILTCQLSQTLVDVQVSSCSLMNAVDTLWALQPIQGTIENLHVDCILDSDFVAREIESTLKHEGMPPSSSGLMKMHSKSIEFSATGINTSQMSSSFPVGRVNNHGAQWGRSVDSFDLNVAVLGNESDSICQGPKSFLSVESLKHSSSDGWLTLSSSSSGGFAVDSMAVNRAAEQGSGGANDSALLSASSVFTDDLASHASLVISGPEIMFGLERHCVPSFSLAFREEEWSKLRCLSLWIPIGDQLSPLPIMGLRFCPSLQEARIKVEGDSRMCPKPKIQFAGIGTFACYPALSKLTLDCSEIVGYALSTPQGHMELSLWERWYLQGIQSLTLRELDYWPPQDRDANRRGLSLPSSGLISQCLTLRKLILHGTINEHLLRMFLNNPNLRDVQLRIDYYPAPEVELNTEMRVDACKRFERALTERGFPD